MENRPARCPGISRDTEEHAVFRPSGFPWLNFRLLLKDTACQSTTRAGLRAMAPRASAGGMEGEPSGFGFTPHHTAGAWEQLHDCMEIVTMRKLGGSSARCLHPPGCLRRTKTDRCSPNLSISMRAARYAEFPPAIYLVRIVYVMPRSEAMIAVTLVRSDLLGTPDNYTQRLLPHHLRRIWSTSAEEIPSSV